MKSSKAQITIKWTMTIIVLLLLVVIISGFSPVFSEEVIQLFHFLLLAGILILFYLLFGKPLAEEKENVLAVANPFIAEDAAEEESLIISEKSLLVPEGNIPAETTVTDTQLSFNGFSDVSASSEHIDTKLFSGKDLEEADFKTIADQIPFMVWRSDPDGHCIYVNKKWISFTGLSYEESLGYGFSRAMALPENEERRHKWREIIKNHQPYEFKFPLKNAEGEQRWVLAQANAYHKDDVFLGYIGSILDITDQENSTIAVQELSDRKDEFLSMASHELKTPLTSIKALFQLIERSLEKDHKAFHFLHRANNNILRLESLITNLLDVSKINAGKLSYDLTDFQFNEMLTETVTAMQNIAVHHRLILHNSEAVSFYGDKFRLEQVIYNFLSNAIKYSPDGKEIIINSEVVNGNIIVSVQDFGIGIEKDNMSRIFNRYYRVDNSLMKFEGLGLGLFISSEIIKRHNGSFWIESELGKGATFYFLLPLSNQKVHTVVETDEFSYYWDETISMQIDPENNWMLANWTGYQNLRSVQEGSMIMLDLVKKNNCKKVLNDNSRVMGNWSEASDWGASEWFPAMADAGVKHFAWIYSPSIFSQFAAEKSADIVLSGISVQFFNSRADAVSWLESV